MFKLTAVSHPSKSANSLLQSETSNSGYLLITQQDEIVYANRQARHYLGLLSDDKFPFRQTFHSLITSMYQCSSEHTWMGWLKSSSANDVRYFIGTVPHSRSSFQLSVEVLEQLIIDGLPILIVSMVATESQETAVTHATIS